MRKIEEIQDNITEWINKLDLGLSIIGLNDLLLELREARRYEAKKEVFDDIEGLFNVPSSLPPKAKKYYNLMKQKHLSKHQDKKVKEVLKCKT